MSIYVLCYICFDIMSCFIIELHLLNCHPGQMAHFAREQLSATILLVKVDELLPILKFEVLFIQVFRSLPVQTIKISLGSQMERMQIKLLCLYVFFYRILELNLLKVILRIKLDQYTTSVRANVLNIQTVVCGSMYSK